MRSLSRIECFNVGCSNEASVTINGDHFCTQCARADLPEDVHMFLPIGLSENLVHSMDAAMHNAVLTGTGFMMLGKSIDPADVYIKPAERNYTLHYTHLSGKEIMVDFMAPNDQFAIGYASGLCSGRKGVWSNITLSCACGELEFNPF